MDRRHESGPTVRTAAARQGEVDADARARDQAAPSVSAVSGPASRDTAATDGARSVVSSVASIQIAKAAAFASGSSCRHGDGVRRARYWRRRTRSAAIAQDLHDGVQQRLTALRIGLSLAAERFGERGETEVGAVLQGFGDDVDHLIDEVRDLAHGIYSTLLTFFGLAAAMVSAGVQSGRPVTVQASGVRRCRPEVEIAVYFSCLAALDNAAKHAGPVPVSVDLSDTGGALHFAVCDSGAGFDPAETQVGAGIANMRDRIAAVGGTLAVDWAPGAERGCMAACRTPGGDNRCATRGPFGIVEQRERVPHDHRGQSRYHFEAAAAARVALGAAPPRRKRQRLGASVRRPRRRCLAMDAAATSPPLEAGRLARHVGLSELSAVIRWMFGTSPVRHPIGGEE